MLLQSSTASEVTIWPSGKHYGKLIVMNLLDFEGEEIDPKSLNVLGGFLGSCLNSNIYLACREINTQMLFCCYFHFENDQRRGSLL